ncbi:MAG TPA: glycosyltransferase 87 family protein [Candidatus Limnocylindria bacterium]|nr:glycosyltransferase 87 family protein [Candidatus Limnocylindria bacterium]
MTKRFVIALLFATTIIRIALIAGNWGFEDVEAYWQAALRLRDGQPLYPTGVDPDSYAVFRYTPWFAWLWVPLTYLDRGIVEWAWGAVLAAASAAIVVALLRRRSAAAVALAMVIAPWLLSLVQVGNIQPLVVAALAFGTSRWSGPLWVAITASLKVVPIAWTLVYVARRDWPRLAITLAVAAVLSAPIFLNDLAGYSTDPGRSFSFYYWVSPAAWLIGAAAGGLLAVFLAFRRSEWVWPAIAVAVMLAAPRSHVTYATFLVIGLLDGSRDRIR